MKQIIALIDCDSFFVSCEQAIDISLKEKPVSVISSNDGCIVSRSCEAKQMGVRMGMPYFMAKKEFPNCIYIKANHELYDKFSKQVMECLKSFSPLVEVCSIDEAFIDLTGTRKLYKRNYTNICKMIREEIKKQTDINVSIGISHSKTLAKLASDKAKNTGGVYSIGKFKIKNELKQTNISEICGIGRNNNKLCQRWGILNGYDFIQRPDSWIKSEMGKNGLDLKHELLGEYIYKIDDSIKFPKSIQKTSAIIGFTTDINIIKSELSEHIHRACSKLRRYNGKCLSVGVMLRTKDFQVYSKHKDLLQPTNFELTIKKTANELLQQIYTKGIIYRSSGIILGNLSYNNEQQLFLFNKQSEKDNNLAKCIDNIEKKYGKNSIKTGI